MKYHCCWLSPTGLYITRRVDLKSHFMAILFTSTDFFLVPAAANSELIKLLRGDTFEK